MSAKILFFPDTPSRFSPRVEVAERWTREGDCTFVVEAYDHNGRHRIEVFTDPDEAEAYADGFRMAYREIFARDIARRRATRRGAATAPAPWWIDPDQGGAA